MEQWQSPGGTYDLYEAESVEWRSILIIVLGESETGNFFLHHFSCQALWST